MRALLRIPCLILPWFLVSCGGGGGGTASGPTPVGEQPGIRVAEGTFYRQDGIVLMGQTVTAVASLPAGSMPTWRFAEVPASAPVPQLATSTPEQASFLASVPGKYRLELSTGAPTPVSATFTVVPPQIEFVGDVTPGSGTTTIQVHGGAANAPMAGCLVYASTGCTLPTSVEATLDGVSLGVLTAPNEGGPGRPGYNFTVATASLGALQHDLRVDVHGPTQTYGGGLRQGFLLFDASKPAQLGVFGIAPADLGSSLTVQRAVFSGFGARVGDRLTAVGSINGLLSGRTFAGTALRLVERPADSTAVVGTAQAINGGQVVADFVADKPGRYTVEYAPVLSDGSTTPPMYATAVVRPHELFFTVTASNRDLDEQPVPPDSDRIAVQVTSDRNPDSSPVSLFLDDAMVGSLAAPNAYRRVAATDRPGKWYGMPVYAFDIPNAQLGTAAHVARVVVIDATGVSHEGSLTFAAGADAQAGFGPFEDPNP